VPVRPPGPGGPAGSLLKIQPPPTERMDVAANCGWACTRTKPDFTTCEFKCRKLSKEPRASPKPADSPVSKLCEITTGVAEGPPLPTATVLTVPLGGTGDRKVAAAPT
jgi:hypothetical protein